MTEVKHNAIKYPSTAQFRNVVQHIKNIYQYKGLDDEGNPIIDQSVELPKIEYQGTVKIHGTNGSLVMFEDGKIYCQSKERMLAFGCDNAGFWEAMQSVDLNNLFAIVKKDYYAANGVEATYPIIISGEWAGGNIQKSVAVNGLHKFFCIFGVKVGDNWQPLDDYVDLKDTENYIFNSLQFETYSVVIDFNNPLDIQNKLIEITEAVEAECPVGKFFGNIGVGEGCVWKPRDRGLVADSGSWYKVKGDKHSSSKVKKLASVDTEKLESIKEFVGYACTESRLEQGIQEVGLNIKLVGEYIGWINRDIFKEEADTLKANNLEMKDCGRDISTAARKFYLKKINENI